MELDEKDIKKVSIIVLMALIGVLAFIIVRPVLISAIGGLILAYIFLPVQSKLESYVKSRTLASTIIVSVLLLIIIVPVWFISPLLMDQSFQLFQSSQDLDFGKIIQALFPTASQQFIAQLTLTINGLIGTLTTSALDSLTALVLESPTILLHLFLVGFVFFYALRDSERLRDFALAISPLPKEKEKILVDQFTGITDAIVYGQVIVGVAQGLLTGLGLLIFGVENALVLTVLATFVSIIPILGPYLIWIPVTLFLFTTGNTGVAFAYLVYNIVVVSTFDNILRSYLVSRKTNISAAVIMVGMIGGLFVFGIMGILLGPLILAYFLIFLKSYKDKNLYSLFSNNGNAQK